MTWSYNPEGIPSVWAPSAFARHYLRNRFSLSFPPLTEMFHFSGFRVSYPMYSGMNDRVLPRSGYPIRISPDHRLLAASRGFSQLAASFFACWHQGIHRTPLLTSSYCKSCYHFHNTTKPFRDLLYCLIAWYACLSCVFVVVVQLPTLLESDCFSAIVFLCHADVNFRFPSIIDFAGGPDRT